MPETANSQIAVPGHFGEWIQGRLGPQGPVALITLSCPALCVRPGPGPVPLPQETIARFFDALGARAPQTGLTLDMPPGAGAGASTACLLALARIAKVAASAETLAQACLQAEGASDPLMLPAPDRVLWASRRAQILRPMPAPPRATILGGFFGAPEPTRPEDDRFADISDLAEAWAQAPDLASCAQIASESARRCTALRGGPDPMPALVRRLGALGHIRAHTGSARGMIFAPNTVPQGAAGALLQAGGHGILRFETGGA